MEVRASREYAELNTGKKNPDGTPRILPEHIEGLKKLEDLAFSKRDPGKDSVEFDRLLSDYRDFMFTSNVKNAGTVEDMERIYGFSGKALDIASRGGVKMESLQKFLNTLSLTKMDGMKTKDEKGESREPTKGALGSVAAEIAKKPFGAFELGPVKFKGFGKDYNVDSPMSIALSLMEQARSYELQSLKTPAEKAAYLKDTMFEFSREWAKLPPERVKAWRESPENDRISQISQFLHGYKTKEGVANVGILNRTLRIAHPDANRPSDEPQFVEPGMKITVNGVPSVVTGTTMSGKASYRTILNKDGN
jgi:hypothetical protein